MSDFILVYMTAANETEAVGLGRALVQDRLAACANILGPIRSIYWWEGALKDEPEVALLAKTRADLLPDLTALVKAMHSYAVPSIVALPIEGGNPDFLSWIRTETRP